MSGDLSPRLGSKLGPRIAMLVHQAIIHAHGQLSHLKHKVAMSIFHAISDEISEEVDITMGPFLQKLHDEVPEDHPAFPAIHFMHTATGQLKALAGTGAQITGLLGTISAIVNNELAPYVYNIVSQSPGQLPDAQTILQAFATGMVARDEARGDLAGTGIQFGWGERMLTLAYTRPDPGTVLDLMRRGKINRGVAEEIMQLNGYTPDDASAMLDMAEVPVSPADAALAVLRGNIGSPEAEAIAAESGLSPASFKILVDNTGEPPGLMQLLEAYRRGFIDRQTLEHGILQSRYRNEWIPMLEQLRYVPMSTADAVNATVQNNLHIDEARKVADQNGLTPGAIDTLVATAGEPLSRTEMEELFNRGKVTRDQVMQALRESRLKNKYNDLSFELHTRLLPVSELARGVRYGTIKESDAVAKAMMLGYSKEDAVALIESSIGERVDAARQTVVSAAQGLHAAGLMTDDEVAHLIKGLGLPDKQAQYVARAADLHRESQLLTSAVRAIRTKYLGHHITRAEASGLLDRLGVPSSGRDYALTLWDVEIQGYTRTLTEAQVVKGVNKNLISPEDGMTRLVAMGYSPDDAALLLEGA